MPEVQYIRNDTVSLNEERQRFTLGDTWVLQSEQTTPFWILPLEQYHHVLHLNSQVCRYSFV